MEHLINILQSLGCGLLLKEFDAHAKGISTALIHLAAKILPPDMRHRHECEWLDYLEFEQTSLSMIAHCLGCFVAAPRFVIGRVRYVKAVRLQASLHCEKALLNLATYGDFPADDPVVIQFHQLLNQYKSCFYAVTKRDFLYTLRLGKLSLEEDENDYQRVQKMLEDTQSIIARIIEEKANS
ncbi:hypothetical protein [Beijerinckia sp. L45]|uniref:hypothetical protein n=1 Tax=Beijerinckia sp. L45 TaxID=1641855 RepID=UPI00131AE09D|nr:hypothetical protein [Beijerinckia sp. L45]